MEFSGYFLEVFWIVGMKWRTFLVGLSGFMCGGTSDAKEMTPEVIEVCHQIRPALEEKLGSPCATFEPKSFKS